MILSKVYFLLLALFPRSISSIKCCNKIKITLGYEAALLHNKTSGIYVANDKYKHDNKTFYQKELGNFGIYFYNKKEASPYQERWY